MSRIHETVKYAGDVVRRENWYIMMGLHETGYILEYVAIETI